MLTRFRRNTYLNYLNYRVSYNHLIFVDIFGTLPSQSILKCPLLKRAFPCRMLRWSALLCWAHSLSRRRALFRLWAAAAAPGPITSSRPNRACACPRTAQMDKDFLRKEVDNAISASVVLSWPLLPFWGPAYRTLDSARWWMRE